MVSRIRRVDELKTGDFIVLWRDQNDEYVALGKDDFINLIAADIKSALTPKIQYYNPTATGFAVQMSSDLGDLYLSITNAATLALGTVSLPQNPVNGQMAYIGNKSAITSLVVNCTDGNTVQWASRSRLATDSLAFRFDEQTKTWMVT